MTQSRLCETVTGRSMADLLAARERATHGDMVELRLDGVADLDVGQALLGRRVPAVVTCRPAWEGGQFTGSEEDRADILARAFDLGAEFLDVEWHALTQPTASRFQDLVKRGLSRVVVSMHDFEGVPADLEDRARAMRAEGAYAIKVAVNTSRLTDTLPLRRIAQDGPAVVIAMGDAGVPSRLLATKYGSIWTYSGNGVAPGQIPAARMLQTFRFRNVGPSTRIFGVVSTNALHSLSPMMHNAAFEAAGIDAVYVPLRASDFTDFLTYAAGIGIDGASVTIPFKRDALHAASRSDEVTHVVGATNTLRNCSGEWEATNTDVDGFLVPLDDHYGAPLTDARASILGAGGAARAVVVALRRRGARVTVHARRTEQACELESLGASLGTWPPSPGSWDLLVNCTPLGGAQRHDESPMPREWLTGRMVYDLTYSARESLLLRDARAQGCRTLDGLPMLIAQAERQFEWWTGQRPTPGVMRAAVEQTER